MAYTVPYTVQEIGTRLAGETITANMTWTRYPAGTDITLKYTFRAGAKRTDADAVASGTSWTLAVAAADTVQWEPGDCFFSGIYTTAAGVVTEIDSGVFIVRQNLAARSYAEMALEAIQANIKNRATSDQKTVAMGDVQLQFMRPAELAKWESKFAAQVQGERNKMRRDRDLSSRQRMQTRFV